MEFNNTTDKSGIIQFTESLCKLGNGGISNDSVLFSQITAYINQAYKKVAAAILRVDTNWRWDDSNYSDFPIATIDLVSSQRDYSLPAASITSNKSTLYKINQIRVKDNSGNWHLLTPLDADAEELVTTGLPSQYRLMGSSVRLSPLPLTGSVTLTDGLEIQFQRSISEFTTSDLTKQPGFMDAYHDILAYDAAGAYLMPYNTNLALSYMQIVATRIALLQNDYARKDSTRPRLKPLIEDNR